MAKRSTRKSKPESQAAAPATSGLDGLSIVDIERALAQRQRSHRNLVTRRERLVRKLEAIDAQLAAMGGNIGSRKRPRNDAKLLDALVALLTGKEMTVTQAAEEVQRAGYVTTSPSFRIIVNQTLINHPKRFKRVSRGVYTAKG